MADNKDIFYLDKIFPEADKIFSENFKSANEIFSSAIIVLDTNVLLLPFDTSEKNVSDIKSIYQKYKTENRLFIPARVAREFANNRASKIGEIFLQIRQLKEKLNTGNFKINQYPILESNKDFKELQNQFDSIQKSIKISREHLENLESLIQSWTWNDNVSNAYKEIFTQELIIEVQKSKDELEKDLAFRIEHKVAPGYKDSNKPDDGIGDLIIWQTVLEIAKKSGKDLIFVTNDQKNDWFYKQDKIGLYPKYELFDEFRRYTGGRSIAIINFIKFLELSKAKSKTIEEIKTSIQEIRTITRKNSLSEYKRNLPGLVQGLLIEHPRFGQGHIMKVQKSNSGDVIDVAFGDYGIKRLLVKFAQLKILDNGLNFLLMNPEIDADLKISQLEVLDERSDLTSPDIA